MCLCTPMHTYPCTHFPPSFYLSGMCTASHVQGGLHVVLLPLLSKGNRGRESAPPYLHTGVEQGEDRPLRGAGHQARCHGSLGTLHGDLSLAPSVSSPSDVLSSVVDAIDHL